MEHTTNNMKNILMNSSDGKSTKTNKSDSSSFPFVRSMSCNDMFNKHTFAQERRRTLLQQQEQTREEDNEPYQLTEEAKSIVITDLTVYHLAEHLQNKLSSNVKIEYETVCPLDGDILEELHSVEDTESYSVLAKFLILHYESLNRIYADEYVKRILVKPTLIRDSLHQAEEEKEKEENKEVLETLFHDNGHVHIDILLYYNESDSDSDSSSDDEEEEEKEEKDEELSHYCYYMDHRKQTIN